MSRNLLEAAERITKELTLDEQVKLADELNRVTRKARWERVFAEIDQRRKGRRFTMAEIQREIDIVRRQRRGNGHSRRR